MKELPYFKFSPIEYINADISFCNYDLQGLFIQICSLSWTRNCKSIPVELLEQRFSNATNLINDLLKKDIIKEDENGIYVSFLREQFNELNGKHELRVKAGSLGGQAKQSNAKAMLKQCPTNKDKDKIKNKKFIPPTLLEVIQYFKENKYNEQIATKAFNYYNNLDWKNSKCKKVSNWKSTFANNWFQDEGKIVEMTVENLPNKYKEMLGLSWNTLRLRQEYEWRNDPEAIKWAKFMMTTKVKTNGIQ